MKTPPALKWMTDRRNRLAGDLARAERSMAEFSARCQSLRRRIAEIDQVCAAFGEARAAALRRTLMGTRERYGAKPGLLGAILAILADAGGKPLTTRTVAAKVAALNGLAFATAADWRRWHHGSVRRKLTELAREGRVEVIRDSGPDTGLCGLYRWRLPGAAAPTLTAVRQRAFEAGVVVRQQEDGR